jgi:hypothetical protein
MIIVITSHSSDVWDGGDSVITEGVKKLLPVLNNNRLVFSADIPNEEIDSYVQKCKYVIHAGTPSWITGINRPFWKACIKYQKHIAMLGVGLALHYSSDIWYGGQEFVELKNSGLIDLIVCRDKLCYYWLHQRLGFDSSKIEILPCPAFYVMPTDRPSSDKKEVVFSIANIDETSRQCDVTFKNYYEKCQYTIAELEKAGASVHILYQRNLDLYGAFRDHIKSILPNRTIHHCKSQQEFQNFLYDKDVYMGVRNHGALPCSGAGKPSLLLGTDYRQYLADEIPFLTKVDISFFDWMPRVIVDWYTALDVGGIGTSMIRYRNLTFEHWQHRLRPIAESIG